ncbi:hypothetical protein SDC9_171654 [bioreactor metagenome]|uniref:Uncharacterized protein n=1 Tax=bioreactor metagenome TaxID=1076179 RepID=A0A645GEQ6_9ZZZZ
MKPADKFLFFGISSDARGAFEGGGLYFVIAVHARDLFRDVGKFEHV